MTINLEYVLNEVERERRKVVFCRFFNQMIDDRDQGVKQYTMGSLRHLITQDHRIFLELCSELSNERLLKNGVIADALREFAVQMPVEFIEAEADPLIQFLAIGATKYLDYSGMNSFEVHRKFVDKENNKHVRAEAFAELMDLFVGPKREQNFDALDAIVNTVPNKFIEIYEEVLKSNDWRIRAGIARSLGRVLQINKSKFVEFSIKGLNDDDPEVRRETRTSLEILADKKNCQIASSVGVEIFSGKYDTIEKCEEMCGLMKSLGIPVLHPMNFFFRQHHLSDEYKKKVFERRNLVEEINLGLDFLDKRGCDKRTMKHLYERKRMLSESSDFNKKAEYLYEEILISIIEGFPGKFVELFNNKHDSNDSSLRRALTGALFAFAHTITEDTLIPIKDDEYDFVKSYLNSRYVKNRTEQEVLEELKKLVHTGSNYQKFKQVLEAGRAEDLAEMIECANINVSAGTLLKKLGSGGTKSAYVAKKGEDDVVIYVYAVNARIKQFMENKRIENLSSLIKRDARVSPFRVSHPNICYFDMNIDARSGLEFGVSELCDGDLVGLFGNDYGNEEKTGFVKQILEGLACAHSLGIVHSDVKPDNIFYKKNGDGIILKLADFGLSQTLEQISDREDSFMSIGHIDIRAPELHSPSGQRGTQADVWSFGCLLYWMWKKQYPFTVEGVRRPNTPGDERKRYENLAYNLKISEEHKRNLLDNLKGIMPDSLIDITAKCWSTDPNERYKDASMVMDAFLQCFYPLGKKE